MLSATTTYKVGSVRPTSRLATMICKQLLREVTVPMLVCPDTGRLIKGSSDWCKVSHLVWGATGQHYQAFGYTYVRAYAPARQCVFVSVVESAKQKLVGTVYVATEISLEFSKC